MADEKKKAAKKTTKKAAAKKASKKAAKKAVEKKSPGRRKKVRVSGEERYRMVQEAAYLFAERDGFQPGRDFDYWLQAEAEVDGKVTVS